MPTNVTAKTTVMPHASELNYSDAEEVYAYYILLCKTLEHTCGAIFGIADTPESRTLRIEGREWLKGTKRLINRILDSPIDQAETLTGTPHPTLASLTDLVAAYDIVYRICNARVDADFVRNARLRGIQRWLHGDKSASETAIALMISDEIKRDYLTLEPRYSNYYFRLLGQWINELLRFGTFRDIPPTEAYQRMQNILSTDLTAYVGSKEQHALKRKWSETYTTNFIRTHPHAL